MIQDERKTVSCENYRTIKNTVMKLSEHVKISWPFLITAIIYVLLAIISISGIVSIPDSVFGIIFILLAATITYVCFRNGKRLQEKGEDWRTAALITVYGGGFLSASWFIHAIDLLL